jgi:hypothetical protein
VPFAPEAREGRALARRLQITSRMPKAARMHLVRVAVILLATSLLAACVVRTRPARSAERRDDRADARFDAHSAWDKLGERWVNGAADRDVIAVGRDDGRYRKLKLVVERSSLELFDVEVVFADGSRFSPQTRMVFGNGSTSRTIDLPGGDRVIRKVVFRYGNLPGGGRAQIELWAM